MYILFFMSMQSLNAIWYTWDPCMQCRLPATIRCLSHPSAHVRALSTSVLRDILHIGPVKSDSKQTDISGLHSPSFEYLKKIGVIDWQADIEKCLTWEIHSRLATGMPINYLDTAAQELGCNISIWIGRFIRDFCCRQRRSIGLKAVGWPERY